MMETAIARVSIKGKHYGYRLINNETGEVRDVHYLMLIERLKLGDDIVNLRLGRNDTNYWLEDRTVVTEKHLPKIDVKQRNGEATKKKKLGKEIYT